jgi:hypothetical protein
MHHTQEVPSMTSYTITAAAIEFYADAVAQFERLLVGARARTPRG